MKIFIVTNEYQENGGGLAFSCRHFVEMLEAIGHDVKLIFSCLDPQKIINGGYKPSLGYELAAETKFKSDESLIQDVDLIISFGGGKNGYYGALLAAKKNIKFWVMYRGSDANLSKWDLELNFYNKYACEKADKIICLSNEIASNITLFYNTTKKIVIIPNSAIREIQSVKNINLGNLIVIGCGATNLNEKKGISILLKSLYFLIQIMPNYAFRLDLVGNIDNDIKAQYDKIVSKYGLKDHVVFYGRKSRADFLKILNTWHFYIQTSICEGMGNSVVDAMSRGIPILITDTGYIAEYAKDRFNQVVFSSMEPVAIATEFCHILQLDDIRDYYQSFYDSFFKLIAPKNVILQWQKLFEEEIQIDAQRYQPEYIISISLHDVQGDEHDNITTPITVFEKFVEDIHERGYRLCSMRDYLQSSTLEKQSIIVCTFDDGYIGLLENALPIMTKYNFTATVYVCSDYLGHYNDWNYKDRIRRRHMDVNELKFLQKYGWEIGSHGVSHQSLLRLNDEELLKQLSLSKKILEQYFGPICTYAYPYGDFNSYIEKQVRKFYDFAFLLTQGGVFLPVDRHRIHRYYISEIYQIIIDK